MLWACGTVHIKLPVSPEEETFSGDLTSGAQATHHSKLRNEINANKSLFFLMTNLYGKAHTQRKEYPPHMQSSILKQVHVWCSVPVANTLTTLFPHTESREKKGFPFEIVLVPIFLTLDSIGEIW